MCAIPQKTLFQSHDFIDVTMADIEDLLDCTHSMPARNKREYFYAHGVDYEKVVTYYEKVKALNETLYPPSVSVKSQVIEYFRICGILIMLLVHVARQKHQDP